MRVIAYTYDADYHCKECTVDYIAFNYSIDVSEVAADYDCYEDSEGNPIHPLFDTDEWYANDIFSEDDDYAVLYCSDCNKLIAECDLSD